MITITQIKVNSMNDVEILRCFRDLESEIEDCDLEYTIDGNFINIYDGRNFRQFKTMEGAFGYVMGWKERECE
jgi:hypothetical protein